MLDPATNNNSGASQSLWMEVEIPSFPRLNENLRVDVCVIGAGIAGLTCAYTLLKMGKSVIVLDQGPISGGQTARTTAHLSWALEDRYFELESLFGENGSKLAAESHAKAIDYIEKIVNGESIDCDFSRVNGYLFNAPHESKDILEKEYAAILKTGREIFKTSNFPLNASFNLKECLLYPNQGQFHPVKYLKGMVQAIERLGGKMFNHTHVENIQDGAPCLVTVDSGQTVKAKNVIVATCSPINNRFIIHSKQAPYRTYVIACMVAKGSVPKALFWDTDSPYHYIRTQNHLSDPQLEWLIIGGGDHKTGQKADCQVEYDNLFEWAKIRFPFLEKVDLKWSGQIFSSMDSLGYIGKNPLDENIYIATGDSGNGMTHGTIAGMLIPELITGNNHPWQKLYAPSRKTIKAAKEFLSENMNVAWQYRDWLTPGENKMIEELPYNQGMILRENLNKIAVYKNAQGEVKICSAFCPHLGGCVRWNPCEKSWDCPCHGSRFDVDGQVMNGPAKDPLRPIGV